eukprot:236867_1
MSTSEAQNEEKIDAIEDNPLQPSLADTLTSLPLIPNSKVNMHIIPSTIPTTDTGDSKIQMFVRLNRFGTYINYGFGVSFSYWKQYDLYPFVAPKYDNLKQELLCNTVYQITLERYNDIYEKGSELYTRIGSIFGHGSDKNTPVAHALTHWNDYCNIKAGTPISLQHLLSILFYTDVLILTTKMKIVCRKINPNETDDDVKKRHVEYVNWLKSMAETLIFYGNRFTINDIAIYQGLNGMFLFDQFKAQFHIPTSATTDIGQAVGFAKVHGIVLQFGGLDSIGTPYFDTASISAYPHEKEYLFFKGELNITDVYIRGE